MSVKEKMTAIADAIRYHTGSTESMTLADMIVDLAAFTGYDISGAEYQTLDNALTVMSKILRRVSGRYGKFSLDEMIATLNSEVKLKRKSTGNAYWYKTLGEALRASVAGDTIILLRDIKLENVMNAFSINNAITIDGAKADGGNYKITANITADTLLPLFQVNADFTMQNVDVELTSNVKSTIIRGGANITVENCNFNCSHRGITFFRASIDKKLSVFNSNIIGGNCVLYLYQCYGDAEITDNSLIDCRADVSDDGTSAVYVSGCSNDVVIATSTVNSENIGVQVNKGSCNLYLYKGSKIETNTSHAIYAGGVGVGIYVYFASNAYVESSKATEPYFTVNTSNYSIKFAEEYERYAMCSGAEHSSGSGGFALEFFDSYEDAVANYFGTLFTYRKDAADDFAANGYNVYSAIDDYDTTYYCVEIPE